MTDKIKKLSVRCFFVSYFFPFKFDKYLRFCINKIVKLGELIKNQLQVHLAYRIIPSTQLMYLLY